MNGETKTLPTVRQLDDAINEVLGPAVAAALRESRTGRVRMHDMACLKAFATDRRDAAAAVLRAMYVELTQVGIYPKASWTGNEDHHD